MLSKRVSLFSAFALILLFACSATSAQRPGHDHLVLWSLMEWPSDMEAWWEQVTSDYESKTGTKVSVEVVEDEDVILDSMLQDNGPDIILSSSRQERWGLGGENLLPLGPFIMRWRGRNAIPPNYMGTREIPLSISAEGIAFSRTAFRDSGLNPEQPPQSWEEMEMAAVKLVRHDESGELVRSGFDCMWNLFCFNSILVQNEGRATSTDGRTSLLEDQATLETLLYMSRLFQASYRVQNDPSKFQSRFFSFPKGSAMALATDVTLIRLEASLEDVGFFLGRRCPSCKPYSLIVPSNYLSISRYSSNSMSAWNFIEFLLSPEVLTAFNQRMFAVPSRFDAGESMSYIDPFLGETYDAIPYSAGSTFASGGTASRLIFERLVLHNQLPAVLSGAIDPHAFLEDLHWDYQRALDNDVEAKE